MENSKIEWCDHTFNPWIGCTKVSEGCRHCYAETQNRRYAWVDQWSLGGTRKRTSDAYWRKPLAWNRKAEQEGTRPRVFCGSLCDVFEGNTQMTEWRQDLLKLIKQTPNLDWLLLTKRPELAYRLWPDEYSHTHLGNIWLGATIESADYAGRLRGFDNIQAAIYFVSVEPMLGPVELDDLGQADWVIVGGESGPSCRPFSPDWARSLRDECQDAGVAFFMKQLGGYPDKRDKLDDLPEDLRIREFPTPVLGD